MDISCNITSYSNVYGPYSRAMFRVMPISRFGFSGNSTSSPTRSIWLASLGNALTAAARIAGSASVDLMISSIAFTILSTPSVLTLRFSNARTIVMRSLASLATAKRAK
ncbi:hypothetical protein DERP_003829 [Dermatophagoides pteronyssinus]|uniref:Uncharacterized protein n=1 Tax=Dermatophagoides pteronyssinus TaxID=6956 RepID=A0ABQ8JLQ3_DERPT|nr:hypothetical protein DERP_003829 [Dermatophagoides pteronyssinus]